jgi:hypothetical protein
MAGRNDDTHFWLMAFGKDGGFASASGTITPERGATRLEMHNLIRDNLIAENPVLNGASIIAFDIQPNKL